MEEQPDNKKTPPTPSKKVKVKIMPNRAIKGVGKAGDEVLMDESIAKQYERDRFVVILKEK